jgi:hypothetical protein
VDTHRAAGAASATRAWADIAIAPRTTHAECNGDFGGSPDESKRSASSLVAKNSF